MTREEFYEFWQNSEKWVNDDIRFTAERGLTDVFAFDDIEVFAEAELPASMFLHGTYNCRTGAAVFTLRVQDVGPITRFCLGV